MRELDGIKPNSMKNVIRALYAVMLLFFALNCNDDDPIQYRLRTEASPEEGGTVSPASATYNKGTEVEIKATANDEYVFKNWSGNASGDENPMKIMMTDDMVITAVFEKVQYALNIEIVGEGSVEQKVIQAKTSTDYDSGTIVELTAVPEEEWVFAGWSGDLQATSNPLTVNMKEAINLTATFEKVEYTLSIDVEGKGTVQEEIVQAKSSTDYDSGTVVRLTAKPAAEWQFIEWSGDRQGSENPVTVTMDKPMSVTAKFMPENLEKTYVPDDNFEKALIILGYDEEMDDYVYTQVIKSVENLNLVKYGIEDLTGIENFEALVHLTIADNQISSLDISENINLEFLNCNNNKLTSLDVSQNINLISMFIMNNPLVCVQIDETQFEKISVIPWMNLSGFFSDDGVSFSLDCMALSNSTTYVPDDNFEQALIDLGLDDVLDDYVKTIDISGLKGLDISDKNISDLTGIEDFAMLWSLNCSGNNISEISLLFGLSLYSIDLSKNLLSSLNLTEFGCINDIDVQENPLSCIQISEEQLQCMDDSGWLSLQVLKDEGVIISLDCGN